MHSQHRNELQQNELGQLTMKAVPWFEKHGMQLAVGAGAAVLLLVVAAVWWGMSGSASEAAWSDLALAETVEQYGDVIDRYPGTLAAAWANLRSGELNFETGVTAMFRDKELGLKDLKASRENFDAVLASSASLPDNVRERAYLGLARVLEATSDGDTGPAVEAYERMLTQFPNSVYKPEVDKRIAELKSPGAKEFYTWFHQEKPEPAAFPRPQDGKGMTLPSGSPFDLPPAAAAPQTTTPAAPEAPASTEKPAEDKPADPAPAATPEKPAGETGAPPAPAEAASPETPKTEPAAAAATPE